MPGLQTTETTASMPKSALLAQIEELKAANAVLTAKAAVKTTLSLKVSEKGAVSVYGMGRFPVTLYGQQWAKLFENRTKIEDFLKVNAANLTTKE